MQEFILQVISKFGYVGVFLLIAIENLFPPIPSEVILTFSGFIAKSAHLNLIFLILASTLGSLAGAVILYYLGYFFNKQIFSKFINTKIGKILHFNPKEIEKSIAYFKERNYYSVFYSRLVPIVRSLISIPAGMAKMDFKLFFLLTTLGSLLWNTVLILLGNMFGENWYLISDFFDQYSYFLLFGAILIYILVKRHKKKKIITVRSL